jgi:integrase
LERNVWTPRNPAALGTKDWDEGCENARDKYALRSAGQPATIPRSRPQNLFRTFADRAITSLRRQAVEANAAIPGKGHKFKNLARQIERDLLPKWGDTEITSLTEIDLNDWIEDGFRVEDAKATVVAHGRQPKGDERKVIYKRPARTTLGNLDWALAHVWNEAVKAHVVDRRARPMINRTEYGEEGESRPFIDSAAVGRVAAVMSETWLTADNGHTVDYKRLLRCYLGLIACSGIRPGLELKRIRIGNVHFREQHGHKVIIIQIEKNQGKHPRPRPVVIYEGDVFDIRSLLADLISWQRKRGAIGQDYLFSWRDGGFPSFHPGLRNVLIAADALTDPMTGGKERVAYSFRHYFATTLIERGLSVAQIAEWLGTSSDMIERHYNRFLTERNAHLVNGGDLRAILDEGLRPHVSAIVPGPNGGTQVWLYGRPSESADVRSITFTDRAPDGATELTSAEAVLEALNAGEIVGALKPKS